MSVDYPESRSIRIFKTVAAPASRVLGLALPDPRTRTRGCGHRFADAALSVVAAFSPLFYARGYSVERVMMGRVHARRAYRAWAPQDDEAVMLYFHGGGYVLFSSATHAALATYLGKNARTTVYAPDYRKPPVHRFPAQLDDALEAYRSILATGIDPKRVAVAGDSAGANLALALTLKLQRMGYTAPGALVLICPMTDMHRQDPAGQPEGSSRTREHAKGDVLLGPIFTAMWDRFGVFEFGRLFATDEALALTNGRPDALVSPVYARKEEVRTFPPTLIHVGTDEVLRDDARRMRDLLASAGVRVSYAEFPHVVHSWQLFDRNGPESEESLSRIGFFVQDALKLHR